MVIENHTNLIIIIILSTIVLVIVSHNNCELTIRNFNSAANENVKKE